MAEVLAGSFGLDYYAGDRAEHDWVARCSPERHPHLAAAHSQPPGEVWRDRSAEQVLEAMASRHGETIGFLIEDLLARPAGRTVLVDYFGVLPRDLAPLLSFPEQAVFLIPTGKFRRDALTSRYADTQRARANWGDLGPAEILEARLARDALCDAEVIEQAKELRLTVLTVDGSRSVDDLASELGNRFRLSVQRSSEFRRPPDRPGPPGLSR